MDNYLRKHSQIYRKRHFLKEKMDKELKKRNNLKNAFGRKNIFNSKELHTMTVKNIKKDIIDKNKKRYHGSSKLKKDELIKFIINKQVSENNRKGFIGAFIMGAHHGAFCLGCCWALMALLFVGGVMNLYWIIGIAAYVAIEKLWQRINWIDKISGVLLIVAGIFFLV